MEDSLRKMRGGFLGEMGGMLRKGLAWATVRMRYRTLSGIGLKYRDNALGRDHMRKSMAHWTSDDVIGGREFGFAD